MNTNEQKHTPGPWKRADLDDYPDAIDEICAEGFDQCLCRVYQEPIDANARLIAAAPELLAALQDVSNTYQQLFHVMPVAWQTIDDIVTAAIAKATGE